jgi:uncharacterized membrane protein YeiB
MVLLAALTGKTYTGLLKNEIPTSSIYILGYAIAFYVFSIFFSVSWRRKFKNGPLEMLMRKLSN